MKLAKTALCVFIVLFFISCNEHYMDRTDVVKGTPSHADTVLPASHNPDANHEVAMDKLPRVFWR